MTRFSANPSMQEWPSWRLTRPQPVVEKTCLAHRHPPDARAYAALSGWPGWSCGDGRPAKKRFLGRWLSVFSHKHFAINGVTSSSDGGSYDVEHQLFTRLTPKRQVFSRLAKSMRTLSCLGQPRHPTKLVFRETEPRLGQS